MADIIDQACDLEAQITAAHVHNALQKAKPEQTENPDGTYPHPLCVDCEAEIPLGRLKLGRVRCIYCQEDLEALQRLRR